MFIKNIQLGQKLLAHPLFLSLNLNENGMDPSISRNHERPDHITIITVFMPKRPPFERYHLMHMQKGQH